MASRDVSLVARAGVEAAEPGMEVTELSAEVTEPDVGAKTGL